MKKSMGVLSTSVALAMGTFVASPAIVSTASAATTPLKIGVITSLTGPLAEYGQEWMRGFKIGIQYATHGTNKIQGRPVQIIVKDDAGNPNLAVQEARSLLADDKVDVLEGCANSASAIAIEPLAERYKTVYVAGPAVADDIVGKDYNKYVFKVSPNSYMESKAAVESLGDKGAKVAQLAPDYSFGWDSVKAFKGLATKAGYKDVLDVYASATATDFTPELEKIIQAKPKYLYVTWAGAPGPWKAIQQMKLQEQGITIVTGIPNIAAISALFQGYQGMKGYTTYYYTLPKNPINNYLVKQDKKQYKTVPDLFDPDGMAAAIATVTGVNKTHGNTNGDTLSKAMAGMKFQGPKGKYQFRVRDHQAMQNLYGVVLKNEKGVNYPVPNLTSVISASSIVPPYLN